MPARRSSAVSLPSEFRVRLRLPVAIGRLRGRQLFGPRSRRGLFFPMPCAPRRAAARSPGNQDLPDLDSAPWRRVRPVNLPRPSWKAGFPLQVPIQEEDILTGCGDAVGPFSEPVTLILEEHILDGDSRLAHCLDELIALCL